MSDYISREAAKELLETALDDDWEIPYAVDRLNDVPAADVRKVRRGRWLDCKPNNPDFNGYECSECGAKYQGISPDNYCPNCGADMKEG